MVDANIAQKITGNVTKKNCLKNIEIMYSQNDKVIKLSLPVIQRMSEIPKIAEVLEMSGGNFST
jgi:pyruvate-formate lyase-activating enzyme